MSEGVDKVVERTESGGGHGNSVTGSEHCGAGRNHASCSFTLQTNEQRHRCACFLLNLCEWHVKWQPTVFCDLEFHKVSLMVEWNDLCEGRCPDSG